MSGKRRKKKQNSGDPDTWDIVRDSQELEELYLNDFDIVPDSQELDTTPAPTYKLKESTKDTHSSVICKLTRILRIPELHEEIKRICVVMKQVQLEGWHLANLHVLRCLQENEEVPELEQMYFYRCCAATLVKTESRDRGSSLPKYPSFHRTCLRYWTSQELVPTFAAENVVNGKDMVNEMARMMNVNALNMIALHFRRRLHQYIRFRYAPERKIELKYQDTKRLVDSCYRVKSVPEVDEDGNPTGKMVKVWTEWDETTDPVEIELRKWLGMVPWQWMIRQNSAHFIRKLYDMLVWMEDFVEHHPTTKGARLYSLLPVSTSFQAAYVKINASTLFGLFARLKHLPKINEFLKNELNINPTKKKRKKKNDEEEEKEESSESYLPFEVESFQNNKSYVMRKVFDIDQFETKSRKFFDEVKTNGYAASITMTRPVTTTSVVVVEMKKTANKKTKKNDGTAQPNSEKKKPAKKVQTPEELADKDEFAKELFKLGAGYSPDVLIGIDPGMRSLVTAVSVGKLLRRRGKRTKNSKHQRRTRRIRAERKQRIMDISTREYRHLAKMNDFRRWNENLKKSEPWYASIIRSMPSFKTANYEQYCKRLQFFWMHVRFLLAFSAERAFLRWRFTQDRAKMKALDTLAKRIVPKASKQVCIAYGDWSRHDGIKGHASGPVKGFVEALKKRATVIPMDEYRTSVTCSCCHKRLKQARLFTKTKRKEDEVDIRTKERPSKKETKEIEEMRKFKNRKLADKKVVLKSNRNVLRCANSRCKANFWNRDVNAARNMLELLRSGLRGKHGSRRLRAFRRGITL